VIVPLIKRAFNHDALGRARAAFGTLSSRIGQLLDQLGRPSSASGGPSFIEPEELERRAMLYLAIKAAISGVIVALVSEIARRYPGWGGLVASLPLTSILAMLWLWKDTGDPERIAGLSMGAFWFVLPSLPMFAVLPWLLRSGVGFWAALALVLAGTLALYALMFWAAPRLGVKL